MIEVGKTGYIFDPDLKEDLEIKMKVMIQEFESMRLNCLSKAEKFTSSAIMPEIQEFLNSLD